MTRNSNKELLERFNNFADSYLNKNGNKLIGIDDAHEHLEQKIDNSIRFSSLREEAAKQLKELGYKPGIVSRGYGGNYTGTHQVTEKSTYKELL